MTNPTSSETNQSRDVAPVAAYVHVYDDTDDETDDETNDEVMPAPIDMVAAPPPPPRESVRFGGTVYMVDPSTKLRMRTMEAERRTHERKLWQNRALLFDNKLFPDGNAMVALHRLRTEALERSAGQDASAWAAFATYLARAQRDTFYAF